MILRRLAGAAAGSSLALALVAGASLVAAQPKPATFPLVEGTKLTFKGARRDGSAHVWTTTIRLIDKSKGLYQYVPHESIANWFSKAGVRADAAGIFVAGESLDGPPGPATKAVAFPIVAGGVGNVPGLFPTTYKVVGKESVKVPAGAFDAWKISIKDPANPEGFAWIAEGTGLVKIQLPSGRVDELVSIERPR